MLKYDLMICFFGTWDLKTLFNPTAKKRGDHRKLKTTYKECVALAPYTIFFFLAFTFNLIRESVLALHYFFIYNWIEENLI
jgi:hypothetical protein